MKNPVLLLLFLCLLSCRKSAPAPDPEGYACGKVITFRMAGIDGTVGYAAELNRYYISSDTADMSPIGVICTIPDGYKVPGKVIRFDGSFSPVDSAGADGQLRKAFPNQEVFNVAITKVYE